MSFHAASAVLRWKAPTPNAKFVMLIIASYANEQGQCWPSVSRISEETGLSDKTIRVAIKLLVGSGVITKTERRRQNGSKTSDEFVIMLDGLQAVAATASQLASGNSGVRKRSQLPDPLRSNLSVEPKEPPIVPQGGRDVLDLFDDDITETKYITNRPIITHKGLNGHQADFDRWYAVYPKKASKGAAEKAFPAATRLCGVERMIETTKAYARVVEGYEPRHVKNPATWLNAKCWDDQLETKPCRDEVF